MAWTFAWAATLALAKFGPRHRWDPSRRWRWAAVAVNLAVGLGWIIAFTRFLRALDELQRKIMQDALAVTLGGGGSPDSARRRGHRGPRRPRSQRRRLPALMGVVFMIAFVVGKLRYR